MEPILFGCAFLAYLIASALNIVYLGLKKKALTNTALVIMVIGFILHTIALILRTIAAKHAPFANLYESLVFFSWTTILTYFILEFKYKLKILGAFVPPIAFLTIGYASVLPKSYKTAEPLVPALQSYWLEIHVIACFVAYFVFAVAFVMGIIFLIRARKETEKLPTLEVLDDLSYKTIAIGFPFLTLGIITGAIWANYAWGSYWSWDPKETWALVIWLIYAAYLHARVTGGWRGKRTNYLNILGFMAVIFTYLGVNLLLSDMHSYAK